MDKTIKSFIASCVILVICLYTILIVYFVLNKTKEEKVILYITPDYTEYHKYGIKLQDYINSCDTIAKYEGLRCKPYKQGNKFYIGFGHQIQKQEIELMMGIDTTNANILLFADLNKATDEGFRITKLTGNRLLCVSNFIFNCGVGKFINSGLYKQILLNPNDTLKIKGELSKWNKFNGKINSKLIQRRNYEYWLYTH